MRNNPQCQKTDWENRPTTPTTSELSSKLLLDTLKKIQPAINRLRENMKFVCFTDIASVKQNQAYYNAVVKGQDFFSYLENYDK